MNGVKDIYHLLLGRWGREWIVDRLIDLAGHTENSWLEFKASMAPPRKPDQRSPSEGTHYFINNRLLRELLSSYFVETMSGDELEKLPKDAIVGPRRGSCVQNKGVDILDATQAPTSTVKSGNFYRTAALP